MLHRVNVILCRSAHLNIIYARIFRTFDAHVNRALQYSHGMKFGNVLQNISQTTDTTHFKIYPYIWTPIAQLTYSRTYKNIIIRR